MTKGWWSGVRTREGEIRW